MSARLPDRQNQTPAVVVTIRRQQLDLDMISLATTGTSAFGASPGCQVCRAPR